MAKKIFLFSTLFFVFLLLKPAAAEILKPCTSDKDCQSDEFCATVCAKKSKAGTSCTLNNQCQSNKCQDNKCTAVEPVAPTEEFPSEVEPSLEVPIPNLKFTSMFTKQDANGRIAYIPYLAEYLAAVYRFLVAISGILAGLMITYAGVKWMLASGNPEKITDAKHKVGDAIIGLILVVGSYVIFYLVNPDLVSLKALRVPIVSQELYDSGEEDVPDNPATAISPDLFNLTGSQLKDYATLSLPANRLATLDSEAGQNLVKAIKEFKQQTGQKVVIRDATRTWAEQCGTYKKYCGTSDNCVTKAPKSQCTRLACFPGPDPKKTNCPHQAGIAVDLWCEGGEGGSINKCCPNGSAKGCTKISDSCPCNQSALTNIMRKNGFCRLDGEIWHFELKSKMKSIGSCH